MESTIARQLTYEEVMNYLDSFEDVDSMMLDLLQGPKPEIQIISETGEAESFEYDHFIDIFDKKGLDGFIL